MSAVVGREFELGDHNMSMRKLIVVLPAVILLGANPIQTRHSPHMAPVSSYIFWCSIRFSTL